MKRSASLRFSRSIVVAQPIDERAHFVVAPHPGRKTGESRPLGRTIFAMPHEMVNASSIGPISFYGDEVEPFGLD